MAQHEPGEALLAAGIWPVVPGAYLTDHVLPHRGVSNEAAAESLGIAVDELKELGRNIRVDGTLAGKLAKLTRISAGFWLNMQTANDRAALHAHQLARGGGGNIMRGGGANLQ